MQRQSLRRRDGPQQFKSIAARSIFMLKVTSDKITKDHHPDGEGGILVESQSLHSMSERPVEIPIELVWLEGVLRIPKNAKSIVVFAHGSGSSRYSPRNRLIADVLHQAGLATLLMDLLTSQEEMIDQQAGQHRFDIKLLARRLVSATDWLSRAPETRPLKPGYFGAGNGGRRRTGGSGRAA